jgi:Molecular chaperone GrpE (heat shock protein)
MDMYNEHTSSQEHETTSEKQFAADEQLQVCQREVSEWKERATRIAADMENYKRRISKEQAQWRILAQADLLKDLLPIVDNFERAMAHGDINADQGITMIYQSLQAFLLQAGVKEVSYAEFNPTYHEALIQVESEDHQSGAVVAVLEKGYAMGDYVIRPAKVSVAK